MLIEHSAFLGLGSNQGDRLCNLKAALDQLCQASSGDEEKSSIKLLASSSVYESLAVGLEEMQANNFYNIVCKIQTFLSPQELLKECLQVEEKLGRIRRNGKVESRIIDIDLLFYEQVICKTDFLQLPHPAVLNRDFVLLPLGEVVDSDWKEPLTKLTYPQILKNFQQNPRSDSSIQRILSINLKDL
jgi:2-amino-4-hydroxy-6-hydroxymethyldihydropteridine diphosphokinase